MNRGGVVAAFAAGLIGIAPTAHAAPAAPAPTATYTTSVLGHPLPVSTMSGAWQVTKPGRAATLTASGAAVTGTQTVIHTTWTSALHRTTGLQFDLAGDFTTLAPAADKNGSIIRIQFRTRHGHWQEFGGGGMNYSSQPLDRGGQGVGTLLEFLHPVTVQWRVMVTATYDDTSQQTFSEKVKTV
jgi:hypothetical protein